MSRCCNPTQSAESGDVVVGGEHRSASSKCPKCASKGRPVERQTILHHVKNEKLEQVNGEAYRFCADPDCEVVYYGDGGTRFLIHDLRELVSAKVSGDKRPICYCFDFTEGDARKEIDLTGSSTISLTVSRLIKAGMCACEVRNPSGACCLGEVSKTEKRLTVKSTKGVLTPA